MVRRGYRRGRGRADEPPTDDTVRAGARFDDVPLHALGRAWGHRRWVRCSPFEGTISGRGLKKYGLFSMLVVGAQGLEPRTRGLKARRVSRDFNAVPSKIAQRLLIGLNDLQEDDGMRLAHAFSLDGCGTPAG